MRVPREVVLRELLGTKRLLADRGDGVLALTGREIGKMPRRLLGSADALLRTAREKLEAADWTSAESLKEAVLAAGEAHGLKLGKAQAPVRVAVTGRTVGLPLFESLEVLGKETTLARIDAALAKLAA